MLLEQRLEIGAAVKLVNGSIRITVVEHVPLQLLCVNALLFVDDLLVLVESEVWNLRDPYK